MFASDLMSSELHVVRPADTIARAAKMMRDIDSGIAPVVDDAATMRLVGVITDRDIAMRCVAAGHTGGCMVQDHMTYPPLRIVLPDDKDGVVLDEMENAGVRRVMVVNDDGTLLGVIALADIVRKLGSTAPEKVVELLDVVSSPLPALA
jgi:CBS domain-containing protein